MKTKMRWVGIFAMECRDKHGKLLWTEEVINNLADEGEQDILDVYCRDAAGPTQFYLRLFNDTPIETDSLSDLSGEASGNNYSAQLLERSNTGWPSLSLESDGDYEVTSSQETFSASGGSWGPVTYCILATSTDNSGLLVSYGALSQARTLNDGESLLVTYKIKLS